MTGTGAVMRLAATAGLCAALLLAAPAHAGFADGVKAYEAGDYAGAHAAWAPLAERGDVAAMRNLGHLYRWGQGVERDIQQAIHWYRRAAETGFSRAQANLAAIYLQGDDGVPIDYAEARKWFEAAAKQGHAVAQYNLGLMYELGLGVEKNEAVALGWYNNAAKAGQPDALERLSLLVMRRDGGQQREPANVPASSQEAAPAKPAGGEKAEQAAIEPAAATPSQANASSGVPAAVADPAPTPPSAGQDGAAPAAAEGEPQRPGLLGRFYSAILSGGGVSIPDLFRAGESGDDAERIEPEAKPKTGD
ncbi:MAG: hypothetical protein ACK4FK_05380 [Ferrovibrio sp.]|uniref:tetratricopeptide repeat protein n=1 Tax=Ferrovibrio sp. TaxID=1917215 RepID=UPI00391B1D2E